MPQIPYTHIIYPDETQAGTPTVAQNSETADIEFQGADAASVFLQTFAEGRSVLVKAGNYDILSPLDLQSGMELAFEPGAILWVPNGYDAHVLGFGERVQGTKVRGGFIREREAGGPENVAQRLWEGVRMLDDFGAGGNDGIHSNVIEGLEIWDADVAIELRIEHPLGWINGNVFRDLIMFRCNGYINFEMSDDILPTGGNGFNRNLFLRINCQASPNTAFGFQGIRHRGNAFLDVKLIDADNNPSAVSASVHSHAEDTLILGGAMTVQNFDDQGERTQIIDPFFPGTNHRQLFLNRLRIEGGDITVNDGENRSVFHLDSSMAHLRVGTSGNEGDITLEDGQGRRVFHMNSGTGHLRVGTDGKEGDITVEDGQGRRVFHFNSANASLRVGANGSEGDLRVLNSNGVVTIHLDGQSGEVRAVNFVAGGITLNVPDYVWDSNYTLMPLAELRAYIAREKRLPNMPSAAEIKREGLNLSQFQMQLLEKIEELTCYLLTQQETIQAQQVQIEALGSQLKQIMQG